MASFHRQSELVQLGLAPKGASTPFAEPGVEPHYAPSRTFRVAHAQVRLVLEPEARTYEGRTTFTIEALPTFDGVARFDLDGVPVHEVVDHRGRALSWRQEDGRIAVEAGDARAITFAYGGAAPTAGLYFTGPDAAHPHRQHMAWSQCQDEDAHFFMPCLDHPRVKHPWSIELEAPEGYTLLSNGAEGKVRTRKGRVTATFEQAEPMPAYLFTAVAAKLHLTEDRWRKIPVRYYAPIGEEAPVHAAFGRTPEMMEVYSTYTGVDYPWPRYDQVVVHEFIFGGMENTACTTMTDLLLIDDRTLPHWDPEGLVCHELAHQWFGDLVTCQDWSQAWLNESWATFLETVWCRHRHGAHEESWYAFQQASAYLHEDGGRYRRPICSYMFREPIDVFDRHLYEKGAVVLRSLRTELGEDAFRAGITHYLQRHAHGTVHGRDFQKAMEEATGSNLDRFFRQWIHGAGHPVLDVTLGEEPGLVTVVVKQTQEGDDTASAFHFPLVIEVVGDAGLVRRVVLPVGERERTWAIPVDGPVRAVRVDPDFAVLAELGLSGPGPWLEALAGDEAPVLAVRALRALMKKGTAQAVGVVAGALGRHDFWAVRAEAARLLGERKGDAQRDWLLAALTEERDPRVQAAVARALGGFREPAAADGLIAALVAGPPTWHLQGDLLEALGRTRQPRAVEVLRGQLAVPSWGDLVRQRALAGLAHTEDPSVLESVLAHAHAPHTDRTMAGAARALGILGDRVPDEALRRRCRERLEALVREGGFRTKLSALAALGELQDPASRGALEQVHASAPDGRVRRAAWEALVKVREGRTGEQALHGLRERLDALAEENGKLRARIEKLERI